MPLYEYRCDTCRSTFELLRPIAALSEPAKCPQGHPAVTRTISLVADRPRGDASASGGCACGGACNCSGH